MMKQTLRHRALAKTGAVGSRLVCVALLMPVVAALVILLAMAQVTSADAAPLARPAGLLLASANLTTTHTLDGDAGSNGWFISAVTVTLSVLGDAHSTYYRLDVGAWSTYAAPFAIADDGAHVLEYYSADAAGNTEPVRSTDVRLDATPPSAAVGFLADYQETGAFTVSWGGGDNGGSGLASFDVQYRDGLFGAWSDWLTRTTAVSATLGAAQRGHVYYFQARARDVAGNVEPYAGGRGDAFTFVDSVANGGFETGSFAGWSATGEMSKSVTLASVAGGNGQWSALLGSPDYGSSIVPTEQLHVPTDSMASLSQTIVVPSLADLPAPALTIWYRVQTYDVVYACETGAFLIDSFDLTIHDTGGSVLGMPLRAGNYDCAGWNEYVATHDNVPPFVTISAQKAIDLTPYAGRTITIEMHNANRQDWKYNTWTYVDNVHVRNQPTGALYRVFLPLIGKSHTVGLFPTEQPARAAGSGGPRR